MNIETDKYLLTSDGAQYILQLKKEIKDSPLLEDKSKIGQLKLGNDKWFFSKMSHAFKRIVDLQLAEDDSVNTMLDISMKIDEIGNELDSLIKNSLDLNAKKA